MGLGSLRAPPVTRELWLQGVTPSPSWAYSVGSNNQKLSPQLYFGGYDSSRFLPGTWQSHPMGNTSSDPYGLHTMPLTMDLFTLNMTAGRGRVNASLISEPLDVMIDSTTPFCWFTRDIT